MSGARDITGKTVVAGADMDSERNEIITRVSGALEVGDSCQHHVRPHLVWEAGQMVTHLKPNDLTTLELAGLIAVLHAAHARVLAGPTSTRPTLTIVPGETAPQLRESVG
jgi:hypothetical protein